MAPEHAPPPAPSPKPKPKEKKPKSSPPSPKKPKPTLRSWESLKWPDYAITGLVNPGNGMSCPCACLAHAWLTRLFYERHCTMPLCDLSVLSLSWQTLCPFIRQCHACDLGSGKSRWSHVGKAKTFPARKAQGCFVLRKFISLTSLQAAMGKVDARYLTNDQQDDHEFLNHLLGAMSDELNTAIAGGKFVRSLIELSKL